MRNAKPKYNPLSYAVLIGIYALSMQATAAESTQKKDVLNLDETVVTGQKIERSRQDTVDSVKVFNSYELEERAKADDFYDIINQTANVVQDGSYAYQIRGISTNGATNARAGGSTIGLFVDDTVVGRRVGQDGALSMWDVEQVEILRGPQSTTSGRNSLAGAFVIRTKDPEFISNGQAKLSYGNHNTYQAAVAQTGPITDKLAYRVAVDHRHTDNYSTNTFFGKKDWDEETSTTVRGKLKYQTDKDNSFVFSASHSVFNDKGDDVIIDALRPERETDENDLTTWKTKSNNFSLKYHTRLSDNWKLTGTTTHSLSQFDRDSDPDGADGKSFLIQDTHEHDTTQEFLFNYDSGKTKAVVGLYYAQGTLDDGYTISDFAFPGLPVPLFVDVSSEEKYKNSALFFNTDYEVSPNITLIAGLRLDQESRDNSISAKGIRSTTTGSPVADAAIDRRLSGFGGDGNGKRSSTNVLPKLGFDYAWSDTLNTGFVVQRGYRPGGVSVNPVRGLAKEYEPEFTTNYELSFRKQSDDKKLKLNTNLFYTKWKDQQVRAQGNRGRFDINIENAAQSNLYGMELEGTYQASDALGFNANIGYSKTKFDDFMFRGNDYKGKEFSGSRNWTAGVGGNYTHPQGYFVNTQLNYTSDAYGNFANTIKLDEFFLWNMKVGYETEAWRTSVYLRNILNQKYVTERYVRPSTTNPSYNNKVVMGAPFTFGGNVEFFW